MYGIPVYRSIIIILVFRRHFNGKGSIFTRLHRPIKVLEIVDGNLVTELQVTVRYVFIKEINNVIGSIYSNTSHSKAKYYIETGYYFVI